MNLTVNNSPSNAELESFTYTAVTLFKLSKLSKLVFLSLMFEFKLREGLSPETLIYTGVIKLFSNPRLKEKPAIPLLLFATETTTSTKSPDIPAA